MVMTRVGFDPACRFSKMREHVCIRRDGEMVRREDSCWAEHAAQVAEQGELLHAAEQALTA